MERTIKMYKGQYQMLTRDKDGKIIEVTIPGFTFSFLGVDFGCSNMHYIAETGELQKDESCLWTNCKQKRLFLFTDSRICKSD